MAKAVITPPKVYQAIVMNLIRFVRLIWASLSPIGLVNLYAPMPEYNLVLHHGTKEYLF
jgi:hypothetical protein